MYSSVLLLQSTFLKHIFPKYVPKATSLQKFHPFCVL